VLDQRGRLLLAGVSTVLVVRAVPFGYTPWHPSPTEVPMRLIGLTVIFVLGVVLAPFTG
jgi:hypothetical protein